MSKILSYRLDINVETGETKITPLKEEILEINDDLEKPYSECSSRIKQALMILAWLSENGKNEPTSKIAIRNAI